MPLINCKISLILTWSKNCVISSATGKTKFAITDTKLCVPVVIKQNYNINNIKTVKQLESAFKRVINWNRYQSKPTDQEQYRYFEYLIDPSFQGVNRLFVLSLENRTDRKLHTVYYIPKVEIKDHNFIIDERNFFDRPIKSDLKTLITLERLQLVKEMITQLSVY